MVRTEGGPRPGSKVVSDWGLPLPELLLADGGQYVKVSEGTRGAQYEWQPGDATPDQLMAAISVALRARRLGEVPGLMLLLAQRDPVSAEVIYDAIQLLGGADA